MRKKLVIFTAAVGFLTLCNIVLYSRKLRTEEEVVSVVGSWRWSASIGHEKRIFADEWTYNSLSSYNISGAPRPPVATSTISTTISSTKVSRTTPSTTTTTTTTSKRNISTTTGSSLEDEILSTTSMAANVSSSFPFSSQNMATTLANRTYAIVNGTTLLMVDVPKASNRMLKVTFNLALLMAEQGVVNYGVEGVLNSSLSLSSTVESGIDFGGANYTGNSSVDVNDVTSSKVIDIVANTTTPATGSGGESPPPLPPPVQPSTGGLSPLNEHPFSLMINVDGLCAGATNLTLLVLVTTAIGHTAHRQAIRDTWGGLSKDHPDVRLAFVMGKPQNPRKDEPKIIQEALVHADILQEDFLDTYKNLTLKTVMLLKWSQMYCPNAKYVMKTDDDMFINIPNLLKYLRGLRYNRGLLLGRLVRGARAVRTITSKYYVPVSAYKDKVYPDYLSGTGYVMSMNVVAKLYSTSRTIPIFFFEDVFITGMCAKKARIVRRNHSGFVFYKRAVKGCAYIRAITGHDNSPNDLRKIWQELKRHNLRC